MRISPCENKFYKGLLLLIILEQIIYVKVIFENYLSLLQ